MFKLVQRADRVGYMASKAKTMIAGRSIQKAKRRFSKLDHPIQIEKMR